MKNLLLTKNSNLIGQLFRYLISGGVAFIIDFGVLWMLTQFCGFNYLLSTVIAYIIGLVVAYIMSILWIFDSRTSQSWLHEVVLFALIGGVGLLLTWFLMWLFTDILHLYYLCSKIVVTVIVFVFNFLVKKIMLFS